ncbi:hypothetical protein XA68_13745 [Ophiocordyceps unilateralis]|uniref:NADH:ubiquinone oxidoreductase intermediate-associated protein 30 domain-containing protein n=1 Tax=Ophiocordyceps unilateralis TaxID=268505 RepID=A0A2A9PBK3_OPHUN|nr:hypothetical protein XA68_13745 [Ophiocordyceps unilateralis]
MRASRPLLARGFLSRSLDELHRRASIAWNLEAVKGAKKPRPLYDFRDAASVRDCILMSDDLIGGSSKSSLDFVSSDTESFVSFSSSSAVSSTTSPASTPSSTSSSASSSNLSSSSSSPTQSPTSYARFHGSISVRLPPDRPTIGRSGYAAFRTPDQRPTVFGRSVWDIDPYVYLGLRVKSDGRAYFINVQTEAIEPSDLHQHRLFVKRPGQWETVFVKWNDFVRTNHGFVVEPQTELLRQKVGTLGFGLTDRVEGPFELCVERVWATNDASIAAADAIDVADESEGGQLRNRRGEPIPW